MYSASPRLLSDVFQVEAADTRTEATHSWSSLYQPIHVYPQSTVEVVPETECFERDGLTLYHLICGQLLADGPKFHQELELVSTSDRSKKNHRYHIHLSTKSQH